ncbi:Ig-like domain-containing protein [Staphylococcus equorum]|uniref:Ig-like domain-containing protein n=1 Tax=Staphylococcus equorum TaxID=246432 RepID=UPI003EBAA6E5
MADTIVSGSVPLKEGAVSQTAKVINADNQIIGSATVNSDGSFAIVIPSSPAGEYTIAIDSPNYANDEVSKFNIIDNTIAPTPTIDPVDDNDTVIVVHGATGSTVTVTDNHNNVIGTVKIANDTTSGSITLSNPLEAGTVLTSTASENGKISDSSKTITVTDATAPDAPIINTVTSEDTQVSGTAEPGTSVRINFPGGGYTAITTDSNGNYIIDIPDGVILEGGESITATSKDDAGNISETATTIVTDITAPETPTVEEVTSEDTQVSGTAEPNSEITVTFPDGTTATGTTDEEGNYTIDIPSNIDLLGGEEVTVVATDKDGNVSEEGSTTVTDVTAPEAPTVEEVTSEDTQVSGTAEPNSEVTVTFPDGTRVTVKDTTAPVEPTMNEVTSENTQVTGTGEPGSMITVKFPDGSVVTGVADNQGNYAIDLPIDKKLNGNEELVVTSTDGAGNVSAETRVTVKDTTAPDAPTVNEVTSEGTQVTGTGEPGSTITVKFPDGSVVTGVADDKGNYAIDLPIDKKLKGNEELVVTSTDGAGNVSREAKVKVKDTTAPAAPTVNEVTSESTQVTGTGEPGSTIIVKFPDGSVITGTVDNQGNYVIDLPADKQINGNEELVVTSTDSSGNVSREAKVTVKDTTAPAAPTVNEVTSGDTQLTGTGEPGSTITVKFPDGSVVTGTVDNQGNYVIDLPVDKKLNGNEELVVTSTDQSGNVSREVRVTVKDTTAPAAPTVNKVTSGDTQVTGTGEPGSTITVKFPNGTIVTGKANNQGNYVINVPSIIDLNPGDTIQVSSIDKSGNMSGTTTIIVNNSSASITKQANDHDKFSNNFDLNSQLGLNGIEGEDGKEHRNPNSNSKHSDDSVNHKSGTDVASKGDVIQTNDEKGTISTMNNDKNNLDKGNNKHVDKLPTTGENENQNKGLFSSLLAMIGAFILIGRRRKNTEEH